MGYLTHLSPEQREALRAEIRDAADETLADVAYRRATAGLTARGLVMHQLPGGVRLHARDAPAGALPLAMLPDVESVVAWLAETPDP